MSNFSLLNPGAKFNNYTFIGERHPTKKSKWKKGWYYKFICDCGTETWKLISQVTRGENKKCKNCAGLDCTKHGEASHLRRTKEYRSWAYIKCNKSGRRGKYPYDIYSDWENNYELFLDAVGRAPSQYHFLRRVDKDLGYFPGNVEWVLPKKYRGKI